MFYSMQRILRLVRRRKELGAAFVVAIILLSILGNTLTFYFFDRVDRPEINFWDGLWYSVVSITTIGYGDISAGSLGARLGTAFFIIIVGLAMFTTAVGMAVDWIVDLRHKERTGMGRHTVRDHLLIVNFPSESRVRQIIQEFRADGYHAKREIVVVADQIEQLPFQIDRVSFIRGWPLEEETYNRANVDHASQAIVLSPSYDDARSDSMVASIAFVVSGANPEIKVVAECLDAKHTVLFNNSDRVALVFPLLMASNLLVQEAQDAGVTRLTQAITSNQIEGTLASTGVDAAPAAAVSYTDVAKRLLDNGVNLVGFIRDGAVVVSFDDRQLAKDDSLVYVAGTRQTWADLSALLA